MSYHKLNLEELLKTHDEYVLLASFMERQIIAVENFFYPLMETGWKGKTADEVGDVLGQLRTIHTEVAGGIRDYCSCVKLVQTNADQTLKDADRGVMQTFDGVASNDPGGTVGASFNYTADEISSALLALESAYESLGQAMQSKEKLKNATAHGSVQLAPYQKQVDEYITDVEHFKTVLQEWHVHINNYAPYIETQLGQGLTDITSFPFNEYQMDASRLSAPPAIYPHRYIARRSLCVC